MDNTEKKVKKSEVRNWRYEESSNYKTVLRTSNFVFKNYA